MQTDQFWGAYNDGVF